MALVTLKKIQEKTFLYFYSPSTKKKYNINVIHLCHKVDLTSIVTHKKTFPRVSEIIIIIIICMDIQNVFVIEKPFKKIII